MKFEEQNPERSQQVSLSQAYSEIYNIGDSEKIPTRFGFVFADSSVWSYPYFALCCALIVRYGIHQTTHQIGLSTICSKENGYSAHDSAC